MSILGVAANTAGTNTLNQGYARVDLQGTGTPTTGASTFQPPYAMYGTEPWQYDFRVERAENGYILMARESVGGLAKRWIANNVEELKDAIITVLVLGRMEGK